MDEFKITQTEVNQNNVKSAPDTIRAAGNITIKDAKHWFDRLPELIVGKFNAFVTYIAENFYKKSEVDAVIADRIVAIGAGDMARKNYDSDNDGCVNSADNGYFVYTQAANGLTGSGVLGRFKAVQSGTFSSISVNGTACSVKCGEDSSVELIEGNWYTFIIDGTTVNFNGGSGLTTSGLSLATAEESHVAQGKTFYSKGDKTLKTGTLSAGTVKATDVRQGVTFYNGEGLEDGARPTGTAAAADVMADKTFDNGTKLENGEIVRAGVYTDAVSCADGEGDVYVRIPPGAYLAEGDSGYPEILVDEGMLAEAIGLTPDKLLSGNSVIGVEGEGYVKYDFTKLGDAEYSLENGTDPLYHNFSNTSGDAVISVRSAQGAWGDFSFTFPNSIDVAAYSKVFLSYFVFFGVPDNTSYTFGASVNGVTMVSGLTYNQNSGINGVKRTVTIDVSSLNRLQLKLLFNMKQASSAVVALTDIKFS